MMEKTNIFSSSCTKQIPLGYRRRKLKGNTGLCIRKNTRASSFYHCGAILRLRKYGILYRRFLTFTRKRKTGMVKYFFNSSGTWYRCG